MGQRACRQEDLLGAGQQSQRCTHDSGKIYDLRSALRTLVEMRCKIHSLDYYKCTSKHIIRTRISRVSNAAICREPSMLHVADRPSSPAAYQQHLTEILHDTVQDSSTLGTKNTPPRKPPPSNTLVRRSILSTKHTYS